MTFEEAHDFLPLYRLCSRYLNSLDPLRSFSTAMAMKEFKLSEDKVLLVLFLITFNLEKGLSQAT